MDVLNAWMIIPLVGYMCYLVLSYQVFNTLHSLTDEGLCNQTDCANQTDYSTRQTFHVLPGW